MSSTPPRRSRPKPPSSSSLPFIPIIIGVIVLGFVIGAGLSVMGHHGSNEAVALATSSPLDEGGPSPTPIPATNRTPRPTDSPEPTNSPVRSPKPSAVPSRSPQPARSKAPAVVAIVASASPVESTSPAPSDSASPPAAAVTPATQTTSGTTSAPATRRPSTPAPATASLAPSAPAAASAAATSGSAAVDADSDFARLAGNVVRQYLLSLSRGDTESAYAALGDGPGSHPGSIPEAGAVDSTMRISKIQARGSDSAASVNVDLTTAAGSYYGQYTVHKSSTGAAVIVSHTFGKP